MATEQLKVMGQVSADEEIFFNKVVERIRRLYAQRHPGKSLLGFSEAKTGIKESPCEQKDNRLAYLAHILKETSLWELYLRALGNVLGHTLPELETDKDVYHIGTFDDHCLAANNAVNCAIQPHR